MDPAQDLQQLLARHVEKDRAGQDAVVRAAEVRRANIEHVCFVAQLAEPLDKRGSTIRTDHGESGSLELIGIPARTAAELEHGSRSNR